MQYLGGKSAIATELAEVIKNRHTAEERKLLIEPFCGGGAMTAELAPLFEKVRAYDIHPDLILMWQALQEGWMPPDNITEMEYSDLSYAKPSALRGFVGFSGFGGKWFGGYGRNKRGDNYFRQTKNSLMRDVNNIRNVEYANSDFSKIEIINKSIVYADPPYSGTTKYTGSYSPYRFWFFVKKWAKTGATVYISEYKAPPEIRCIWEQSIHGNMKMKKVIEKLFLVEPTDA